MSAVFGIAFAAWLFITVAGFLAMVMCFAVADSDDERDRTVQAAGWALIWPVWLAWQVRLMVAWAWRADR